MRNLSWARMITWACYWWPDGLWCVVGVAQFLNKVGKHNKLQLFCSSDYCVWRVFDQSIQSSFQTLHESDGCLQVVAIDHCCSVVQYCVHNCDSFCICLISLLIWSIRSSLALLGQCRLASCASLRRCLNRAIVARVAVVVRFIIWLYAHSGCCATCLCCVCCSISVSTWSNSSNISWSRLSRRDRCLSSATWSVCIVCAVFSIVCTARDTEFDATCSCAYQPVINASAMMSVYLIVVIMSCQFVCCCDCVLLHQIQMMWFISQDLVSKLHVICLLYTSDAADDTPLCRGRWSPYH